MAYVYINENDDKQKTGGMNGKQITKSGLHALINMGNLNEIWMILRMWLSL